ncbi:MAG: Flp family type IVb pilin [Gemmatimonadetes bacterium]|nr:Flp family type IVb pilin [Gemmatimonadota bacterium]
MLSLFGRFWTEDAGQGLTEYALILALVSVGLIAIMVVFRDAIGGIFSRIAQVLEAAPAEGYQP